MDSISNLPDDIIRHIGSFLSVKEAAFTTVLSKRWRNLIPIISKLHYDVLVDGESSLKVFVDQVVVLPTYILVRKLSLRWSSGQSDHIKRFLSHVVKHGLVDIELRVIGKERYSVPFEVFTCKTVAKLTLGSNFVVYLPRKACLPEIQTVVLHSVRSVRCFDLSHEEFYTAFSLLVLCLRSLS